ncbi:cilia- and flagella-associated protein 97-like isoform X2 [Acanthaster planci]|uniref:Cilia- and flagella-associated protein 97-like isoform X2 n=1 Tax=Acanthaster planci TaxID=133434 RepID=A0A8B7XHH6_ACAPL|nr:cilia- and flagella-associated protein 97-like isoform X2 [Acanthaster planci]
MQQCRLHLYASNHFLCDGYIGLVFIMDPDGTPEPIDFDFFAEDDGDAVRSERISGRSESPLANSGRTRPESAGSVRSAVSSRNSISVKIPYAGPTGNRENYYSAKGTYSDSSEDEHSFKDSRFENKHPVQTNLNLSDRESRERENGMRFSEKNGGIETRTSSNRPKTSKGLRSHRRRDSSSSHGSSTSKSNRSHTNSSSSKSEHSDSYTSVSDSDSDVTDVSPLPSPARSPTPTLEYDQDEFEDSFEEKKLRWAKAEKESFNGDSRHNRRKTGKKESVRFAGVTPSNGTVSKRDKHIEETEARELSRLLRAVLEMDDTPNRSPLHTFHQPATAKLRPMSAKKAPTGTVTHPMPHQRVNLSFSNDKVRQIDRENQRLLQKILQRPKSGVSTSRAAAPLTKKGGPPKMTSHSAIRRQREQQKIEMENMKILERIEAARASSTVRRDKLLQDHSKQMKYAAQVSKGSVRPHSSKLSGYSHSGSLGKGSSTTSLNSDVSRTTTGSAGSRKMRPSSGRSMPPPPRGPKQAWDDRW